MGQITDCWSSCCPCPAPWSKGQPLPTARTSSREDNESTLLPPLPPKASQEAHEGDGGVTKSPMLQRRRSPSHLRGLDGEINQVVRLVLVGSCDTGKTCLLRRFLGGYFDEDDHQDYTRTLGVDFGCKTVELTDRRVRLQMWDTGGSETYRSVLSHYLRGADGIVLCFDINRMVTLRDLRSIWAPYVDTHAPRTCRVLLVGNKADLHPDREGSSGNLTRKEARRVAKAIDSQLFETSARLGTNIDVAVLALMREVLHHRQYSAREATAGGAIAIRSGRQPLSEALRDALGDASSGGTISLHTALREKNKSTSTLKSPSSSPSGSSDNAATCRGNFNEPGSESRDRKGKDDGDGGGASWPWLPGSRQSTSGVEGGLRSAGGDSAGGDSAGGNRAGDTGGDSGTRSGTKIVRSSVSSGENSRSVESQATVHRASDLIKLSKIVVNPQTSSSRGWNISHDQVQRRGASGEDEKGALAEEEEGRFTGGHHGPKKNRSRGHALSKPITISPSVLRTSKTPVIVPGAGEASLPFKGAAAASTKASGLEPLEGRKSSTYEVVRSRRLMSRSEQRGKESIRRKGTRKHVPSTRPPQSLDSTDSLEVTLLRNQDAFSAPRERGRDQSQSSVDSVTMVDASDISSLSESYSFT